MLYLHCVVEIFVFVVCDQVGIMLHGDNLQDLPSYVYEVVSLKHKDKRYSPSYVYEVVSLKHQDKRYSPSYVYEVVSLKHQDKRYLPSYVNEVV